MRGADEPKTASYSIQAKLLKLFVLILYGVAIVRMMRGAFPDFHWTWRRWLPKATRWPQGLLCGRVSEHRRRSDSGAAFAAQSRRTDLRDQRDRSGPCFFFAG